MTDLVFNIAKGRIAAYAQNVEDNSPAGSELLVIPFNSTGATTDANLKDANFLSDLEALTGVTEAVGSTWARKSIVAANLTIQVDDTNDWVDVDIDDQTWSAVAAGNDVTHLAICYDPGGASADTAIIPLTWHDFAVTTDGSDITAVIDTEGFFRAT